MEHMEGLCMAGCERRPEFVNSRSYIANGVCPDDANLLFLGEASDAKENEGGEPFVGRSGPVLDDALREASLARADARIANCVRCRSSDNHDPADDGLSDCRGYLACELGLVDPELVATLGKVPSRRLLSHGAAIANESGSVVDAQIGGASYRFLLSVHPTTTLHNRDQYEGLFETIARVVDFSGLAGPADGQTSLGDS